MKDTSSSSDPPVHPAVTTAAQERLRVTDGGELVPGTLVGEYRIEQQLGRGGMGTVYAARHPVIGKRVAIKVLAPHLGNDPALVRRFVDEARAVNKIGHPNIIDIFAFGQLGPPEQPRQYFVMEHLDGETLAARLARSPPLPQDEARRLLVQTADALEAAHRERIVHRDLKPENLWIARPKHGPSFMKVLDFGIAKLLEPTIGHNVTERGTVIGTPHFMAPEQCLGQTADHRVDIYALGVVLYEVFAGKLPFEGKSIAEIVGQKISVAPRRAGELRPLPAALDDLIAACLKVDPAQRPQSAAEVGRRLESASSLGSPARPGLRGGALVTTVVLLGAAAVAAGVVMSRRSPPAPAAIGPPAPQQPVRAEQVPTVPLAPPPAPTRAPAAVAAVAPRQSPPPSSSPGTRRPPAPPSPSRVDEQGLIKENPFAR